MNLRNERSELENGATITVIVERRSESSRWTVTVIVTTKGGERLPPRADADESFSSEEEAFEKGFRIGREMVNRHK